MIIKSFTEIKAWQKAHELVIFVYNLTNNYPKTETYNLTSQTRRSAVSIPSNLAEGFKRTSRNDSVHFYNIAEGSLEELKYQLLLARDLRYIDDQSYKNVYDLCQEVGRLINGWIKVQK